jgi:glutathione S-transferase
MGEAAATSLPSLDAEIALQLGYINGALSNHEYLLGDELTAADIQLSFVGELAAARFGVADRRRDSTRGAGDPVRRRLRRVRAP